MQDGQEIYAPPFLALTPSIFSPPQEAERPPLYSIDESGSISFQPKDSNWIFSASIQYGRARTSKHVHHQTYSSPYIKYVKGYYGSSAPSVYPQAARFTDAKVRQTENHTILDFQAGKDLGLGLFGHDGTSSLSAGIRIAQFQSRSRVSLNEDPDWHFVVHAYHEYGYDWQQAFQPYHSYSGTFSADRSFRGVGPSISWKSNSPFAGSPQNGELSLDWSVNAAVLFGRQKTKTHHQTTGRYHREISKYDRMPTGYQSTVYHHPTNAPAYHSTRSRNVTVPNVGGSVGLTWRVDNFKASFGYKVDFFFGAIDGGIDTRKNEDRAFYGPYASISIGLGD